MTFKIEVRSWARSDLRREYDLAYAVLGYETRSSHAMRQLNPTANIKLAWGFGVQEQLAFRENQRFFSSSRFDCSPVLEDDHEGRFSSLIREIHRADGKALTALVDVSSITRRRMADVMWSFACLSSQQTVSVDFVYALAKFQKPGKRATRNADAGPVSSCFAGWWGEPERPLAAIVGLGYEEDKALGMVEHLQAPDVWTFEPKSVVTEYSDALELANRRLSEMVPIEHHLTYSVEQPYQTLIALESLIDGLSKEWNTVLVPFGPKVFTLISMLVALRRQGTPVWRVSAGLLQKPRDAKAEGPIYGLRVTFRGAVLGM